jgi:hypothetical protein
MNISGIDIILFFFFKSLYILTDSSTQSELKLKISIEFKNLSTHLSDSGKLTRNSYSVIVEIAGSNDSTTL